MEREPTRLYRRRKKHQGSTWTPERQPALYEDGQWCRACKTRHGYMTMKVDYEKRNGHFVILWLCRTTGNVIGETKLGAKSEEVA
jgi:hypothetical protein